MSQPRSLSHPRTVAACLIAASIVLAGFGCERPRSSNQAGDRRASPVPDPVQAPLGGSQSPPGSSLDGSDTDEQKETPRQGQSETQQAQFAAREAVSESVESSTSFVVVVEGVEVKKGIVKIAIFDNEDNYQRREDPLRFTDMQAEANSCTWRVEGLPPGLYAVAAFQDQNGNGELDKGTFGIPLEHYGFSNHPKGKLRPPSYDRARVGYRGEAMQVDILLR